MGYARYGKKGKGLSDKAQRTYSRAQTTKAMRGVPSGRGIFQDIAAMRAAEAIHELHFVPGTGGRVLRGAYQPTTLAREGVSPYRVTSQAVRSAGLKARGVTGEMTTIYSKHRGMPQVLQELLAKEKEPGAPSGVSFGKVVVLGAIGYGLWAVLA